MKQRLAILAGLLAVGVLISWQCATHSLLTALVVAGAALAVIIIRYPVAGLMVMIVFFLASASPLYQQYAIFTNSYTATDLVGVLVVGGIVLRSMGREHVPRGYRWSGARTTLLLAVGAYFGWGMLALAWSPATIAFSEQYIRHVVEDVAILGLALLVLDDPIAVRRAAGCYALTTVALAVYTVAVFQQLHGFDATAATTIGQLSYRSGGVGDYNENELAIMIAIAPCFAYLATQGLPRRFQLLLTCVTIPPVGLALIILSSREAIIALVAACLLALILTRDRRYRVGMAAVIGFAALTYLAAAGTNHIPWYFQQRFADASSSNIGNRLPGWEVGLQLFAQNPLTGVGTGGFQTYITSYHVGYALVNSPHSDYIGTLADTGLIGFILLVAMLVALAFATIYKSRGHPATVVVFSVLAIDMAAGSILQVHWIWVALGIASAFGLRNLALRQASSPFLETTDLLADATVGAPAAATFSQRGV